MFKRVWNWKKYHLLTFVQIKNVSGVMRSCYLFLQVPMVMKKCLQTYYIIAACLKNLLRRLKSSVVIRKIVTFYIILNHFGSNSGLKRYETQKIIIFSRFVNKNCVRCRTIMWFVSKGTYDHVEVLTNFLYHCHWSKIFLRHTKSLEISQETILFA